MLKKFLLGIALLVLCAGISAVSAADPSTVVGTAVGGDEGWYCVNCNVDGASVYFDGQYKGTTSGGVLYVPVYSTGTPYSSYRVERSGYQSYSGSLPTSPGAGETVDVYATLQPVDNYGSIRATSSPSGAAIYLNGNYQGTAPVTINSLSPGTYSLRADLSGYISGYDSITVTSGQQSSVQFTMTPIQQYGSLTINSNPSGAYIYMDGVYKGQTPLTLSSVAARSHNVELDLSGYYDWATTVSVTSGVTRYVNAQLTALPSSTGSIAVDSNPAGASVYLDGKLQGATSSTGTYTIQNVAVGSHTVAVTMSGYQDYMTTITVASGTTSYVSASLQIAPTTTSGSIDVTSSPAGAEIYVDNAYKGITPLTVSDIAVGAHTVMVSLSGYTDWSTSVQVGAGSVSSVSAALSPVATPTQKAGMAPVAVIGALGVIGLLAGLRKRD